MAHTDFHIDLENMLRAAWQGRVDQSILERLFCDLGERRWSKYGSRKPRRAGTSQKAVVLATYVYILMLPPLSLTRKQALAIARLHGFRRLVPILARLLSGLLSLSLEDVEIGCLEKG